MGAGTKDCDAENNQMPWKEMWDSTFVSLSLEWVRFISIKTAFHAHDYCMEYEDQEEVHRIMKLVIVVGCGGITLIEMGV